MIHTGQVQRHVLHGPGIQQQDGAEPQREQDGGGHYDISTADELYAFAAAVNSGSTETNEAIENTSHAAWVANIDLDNRIRIPIGLYSDSMDSDVGTRAPLTDRIISFGI